MAWLCSRQLCQLQGPWFDPDPGFGLTVNMFPLIFSQLPKKKACQSVDCLHWIVCVHGALWWTGVPSIGSGSILNSIKCLLKVSESIIADYFDLCLVLVWMNFLLQMFFFLISAFFFFLQNPPTISFILCLRLLHCISLASLSFCWINTYMHFLFCWLADR